MHRWLTVAPWANEPATHTVCQYNAYSLEDLVDGFDAVMCEPHARAMVASLAEWEG